MLIRRPSKMSDKKIIRILSSQKNSLYVYNNCGQIEIIYRQRHLFFKLVFHAFAGTLLIVSTLCLLASLLGFFPIPKHQPFAFRFLVCIIGLCICCSIILDFLKLCRNFFCHIHWIFHKREIVRYYSLWSINFSYYRFQVTQFRYLKIHNPRIHSNHCDVLKSSPIESSEIVIIDKKSRKKISLFFLANDDALWLKEYLYETCPEVLRRFSNRKTRVEN
jgi:hypothetical protein